MITVLGYFFLQKPTKVRALCKGRRVGYLNIFLDNFHHKAAGTFGIKKSVSS